MTKVAEKLVLSFESEQGYQPSGHNLSAEQAVDLTRQFAGEGRVSKVVDQETHHRTLHPNRCKLCQKTAEEATNKHSQEHASAAVSGEEPENE